MMEEAPSFEAELALELEDVPLQPEAADAAATGVV